MTPTRGWDYRAADLLDAMRAGGIKAGDIVFVHVCLDALGVREGSFSGNDSPEVLYQVLQQAVGATGTILMPSYTFSFCRQEIFDVQSTPSAGGPWSTSIDFLEFFRQRPGAVRSRDPIHSVVGIGPKAEELLTGIPNTCFGEDSVHDRLKKIGGKICTIGVGLHEATFRHHAEETFGVPFRFKKLFTGYIRDGGQMRKEGWIYYVRILAENGFPDGLRLEEKAKTFGLSRVAHVGKGEVTVVECQSFYDLITQELARDPWCSARGPAGDVVQIEDARIKGPRMCVSLQPDASMSLMIEKLWRLPRQIISDGYDAALEALAGQLPMTIHRYPTGTECWSWIVPEKWTCHEAYLETLSGHRLFSYAGNPLHVVSYSLPFSGEVSRDELFKRLHVHPRLNDAIPFVFNYYERDWGLCCSKTTKDSLTEERYSVVIKTDFSYGTLKVGEVVAKGSSEECIVLCAHLCHPAMVNDDLTGVVVGMKVMQELLRRTPLRYTYRFLIVPETIGSLAFLSHNEDLIPKMKGGLFLEMLGRDTPHALQRSFDGRTEIDDACVRALHEYDQHAWTGDFRAVIGNDERQFNGPGVRVPMLSLSRVLPPSSSDWPYPEYHSSFDTPDHVSMKALEESRDLVLRMIETLESNLVPLNKFKGEVFCSRYGVHIDPYLNPQGNKALFDIMDQIDGTRSVAQIADSCGISFDSAKRTIDELRRRDLVEYKI